MILQFVDNIIWNKYCNHLIFGKLLINTEDLVMNKSTNCVIPVCIKKPLTIGLLFTLLMTIVPVKESPAQDTYRVAHGNTLYSIALMHDVTVNELKTWNNLSTERIYTGQLLIVSNPMKHGQESNAYSPEKDEMKSEAGKIENVINPYSLHISELEIKYDQYLELILSRFFNPKSFKVDVRFDFQKAGIPVTRKAKQLPIDDMILPGMPFVPEEIIRRQRQQIYVISPDDFNAPLFQVNRMSINVYTDISYSGEDFQFMKEVLSVASKLNDKRGDTIVFTPIVFPNISDYAADAEQVEKHSKIITEPGINSLSLYFVVVATVLVIILLFFVFILLRKRL